MIQIVLFLLKKSEQTYNKEKTQNIVSSITEKLFHCMKCDESFSGRSGLYSHNKAIHEGVKHSCNKCNYSATLKTDLKRHMMSVHEGMRPYVCYQCDFKTADKKSLQYHLDKKH